MSKPMSQASRQGIENIQSRNLTPKCPVTDTTTPGGRLVFHLFGALGQFERDLIQERTRAGLAAASAQGRKGVGASRSWWPTSSSEHA